MAKLTYDEAVAQLATAKENLKEKREELRLFKKEKELKGDAEPKAAKDKKKLASLNKAIETLVTKRDKLAESVKELKPKKERVAKYTYPTVSDGKKGKREMDEKEKKKYRSKMRAEAKKAEKGAGKPAKKEKTKKTAKADKPAKAKKTTKKKK